MSSKYYLCVDSSLIGVGLALVEISTNKEVWREVFPEFLGSAKMMIPLLQKNMQKHEIDIQSIGFIIIANGPGSFTGIKIGLASIYGLIQGLDSCKIKAISGLAVAASAVIKKARSKSCCVAIRSTRTHGYLGLCVDKSFAENKFLSLLQQTSYFLENVGDFKFISALTDIKTLIAIAELSASFLIIDSWQELPEQYSENYTSVALVLSLSLDGMQDYIALSGFNDFKKSLPKAMYLRKSSAEENKGIKIDYDVL